MWYFATAKDRGPYEALRAFALKNLIVLDKSDPFTLGFCQWRCQDGLKLDASGTTEMLRISKALWTGAKHFDKPDDAELALVILEGYGRHGGVDQGIWMIRNWYSFMAKSFATNSFIIDYDPDYVRQVATETRTSDPRRSKVFSELADNCFGVFRRAVSQKGLLYDLLQPELKTMYYGMDVSAFSPNDIIQSNNACTTASTIAINEKATAMRTLQFFVERSEKPVCHYYARTGEAVTDHGFGGAEFIAVARLAALLGDRAATATFVEMGLPVWEWVADHLDPHDPWTASELLIGLHAILELGA